MSERWMGKERKEDEQGRSQLREPLAGGVVLFFLGAQRTNLNSWAGGQPVVERELNGAQARQSPTVGWRCCPLSLTLL